MEKCEINASTRCAKDVVKQPVLSLGRRCQPEGARQGCHGGVLHPNRSWRVTSNTWRGAGGTEPSTSPCVWPSEGDAGLLHANKQAALSVGAHEPIPSLLEFWL